MAKFTVAACQMDSKDDKETNIDQALSFIDEAADANADIVSLPEMFTFMGAKEDVRDNAEPIPGPVTDRLAEKAREHSIHIHAGSMYERADDEERVHNTTVLFDSNGKILDTYRKIHLFDVELGDDVDTKESDTVVPGNDPSVVETDLATFGLTICYDLRFPELFSTLSRQGTDVIFMPAAFTMFTGKDHWEPLLRARAIENQAYVIAPGQIGHKPEGVPTYGKTMVIDPWGNVISKASDRTEMITAEIDLDYLTDVRRNLPSTTHKRYDTYEVSDKEREAAEH